MQSLRSVKGDKASKAPLWKETLCPVRLTIQIEKSPSTRSIPGLLGDSGPQSPSPLQPSSQTRCTPSGQVTQSRPCRGDRCPARGPRGRPRPGPETPPHAGRSYLPARASERHLGPRFEIPFKTKHLYSLSHLGGARPSEPGRAGRARGGPGGRGAAGTRPRRGATPSHPGALSARPDLGRGEERRCGAASPTSPSSTPGRCSGRARALGGPRTPHLHQERPREERWPPPPLPCAAPPACARPTPRRFSPRTSRVRAPAPTCVGAWEGGAGPGAFVRRRYPGGGGAGARGAPTAGAP